MTKRNGVATFQKRAIFRILGRAATSGNRSRSLAARGHSHCRESATAGAFVSPGFRRGKARRLPHFPIGAPLTDWGVRSARVHSCLLEPRGRREGRERFLPLPPPPLIFLRCQASRENRGLLERCQGAVSRGVKAGGGQIKDCLKTHIKDLSDDCKAVLLKAVNVKACAPDVKQFCADTKPGEGRVEACMKAHIAEVSDACKVAMANAAAGND